MIQRVDEFVLNLLEKVVNLLQDWFFLSQKQLERSLLWAYPFFGAGYLYFNLFCRRTVVGFNAPLPLWVDIFYIVLLGRSMWCQHREPTVKRTVRRVAWVEAGWRLVFLALLIFSNIPSCFISTLPHIYHIFSFLVWGSYVAMHYLTVLNVEGERGKAAKLAWDKIKELFGTSWVAHPVGQN